MGVSCSAYYDWANRPLPTTNQKELLLIGRMKSLFKQSHSSLGSREMMKKPREEGFDIGRYRVRKLMERLGLVVTPRIAYKVTTKRKASDAVADNFLNQNFNPRGPNEAWASDVTYLKTGEGWMYLAVVMELYSRRIVGWHIDKRMTTSLVNRALIKAYNIRQLPRGVVFHSDRGSQYTSKRYRSLLEGYGIRASMGDVGACWDNAVVELFGSLKKDVTAYMRYYNSERLHSPNGDLSPVAYESRYLGASDFCTSLPRGKAVANKRSALFFEIAKF